jgi:hypothetical protein
VAKSRRHKEQKMTNPLTQKEKERRVETLTTTIAEEFSISTDEARYMAKQLVELREFCEHFDIPMSGLVQLEAKLNNFLTNGSCAGGKCT